ncbi:MAG: cation acetate symporter [Nitriliruptor sp.]
MRALDLATLLVFALVVLVTSAVAWRRTRSTTVDYFLAGRRTGTATNACAICGDYLSAASFLGVAAAVYASGLDGVWYATGFAAGFVPVLLFVAAPLRRLGAVSLPDFLAVRFTPSTGATTRHVASSEAPTDRLRLVAVIAVELVILSYLVPQSVGSGLTWELLVGTGLFNLSPYATGVVVSAVAVSAVVVVGGMRGTTWNQAVQFGFLLAVLVWLVAIVTAGGFRYAAAVEEASAAPLTVVVDDRIAPVPDRIHGGEASFARPGARYGAMGQAALLVTLVLGTAGLPHVMNRYFTSPTGRAARTTTVWVLGLAGLFYALAVLLGTAARVMIPRAAEQPWLDALTVDGVLRVPEHALLVLGRIVAGTSGIGLVATAAFAAMVSTMGGLLLAAAASWGHDVVARVLRPDAGPGEAVAAGRVAIVVVSAVSALVALAVEPSRVLSTFPSVIATMVTWAFALAGSAITPTLLLSIWWRGTTVRGAIAGISVGGGAAVTALAVGLASGADPADGVGALLLAPTLVAAPLSALTVALVSRADPTPFDATAAWVRMHGTAADRQVERMTALTVRGGRR